MIGKQSFQISILDSALNTRSKRSRSDELLKKIETFVNWEELEHLCEGMYKASRRGRPTLPILFSLKCLILQYLYDLSDPSLEDALIDRLSFQRFLGISFDREIPDFSTIWRFRDRLIKANLLDRMFEAILTELDVKNVILRKGTLIDATLIEAARKPGKDKGNDNDTPRRKAQRDTGASHTQKGKKHYYGYKGHIGVDQGSNIIRKRKLTTARVHDIQQRETMLSGDERAIFADKAYYDDTIKRKLRREGIYNGILDKGRRNRPLSKKQKKDNKQKSAVRNAVERPFAYFKCRLGFRKVRYVTLKRNELHFTFLCIIHNIRRGIALTAAGT